MAKRRIPDGELARIAYDRVKRRMTYRDLATKYGRSSTAIRAQLPAEVRRTVPIVRKPRTIEVDVPKGFVEAHDNGATTEELADWFTVRMGSLRRIMKHAGLTPWPQGPMSAERSRRRRQAGYPIRTSEADHPARRDKASRKAR